MFGWFALVGLFIMIWWMVWLLFSFCCWVLLLDCVGVGFVWDCLLSWFDLFGYYFIGFALLGCLLFLVLLV